DYIDGLRPLTRAAESPSLSEFRVVLERPAAHLPPDSPRPERVAAQAPALQQESAVPRRSSNETVANHPQVEATVPEQPARVRPQVNGAPVTEVKPGRKDPHPSPEADRGRPIPVVDRPVKKVPEEPRSGPPDTARTARAPQVRKGAESKAGS